MAKDDKRKVRGQVYRGIDFSVEERRALVAAGFSHQSIWSWRHGWSLPNRKAALEIAQLTGRSLIELVFGRVDILAEKARGAPEATLLTREERRSAGR